MDPALAERWPALAGEKVAALCRPGRMTGRAPGKTLELYVANGAAAAAVQMEIDGLIARLNAYLGPGALSRVTVIQTGRDPAPAPRQAALPSAEPETPFGAALASFRAAISRRKDGK